MTRKKRSHLNRIPDFKLCKEPGCGDPAENHGQCRRHRYLAECAARERARVPRPPEA